MLVDDHDPASYARALRELIGTPGRRDALSRGGVAHASRFGWSRTVDRLLGVYAGAMSNAPAPARALPS